MKFLTKLFIMLCVCQATIAQEVDLPQKKALASSLLQPADITYLGAFRLPNTQMDPPHNYEWSGQAITFNPNGDPNGAADGFPGSLYVTGHGIENYVGEIAIPIPSTARNMTELNRAETIQDLADIKAGLFPSFVEIPRVSFQILPAQTGQATPLLHIAWGQHNHNPPDETGPTHAWCDLDLSNPNTQGAWWIGDQATNLDGFIYRVNGYMFEIPAAWGDTYLNGMHLASGRSRDGGLSGMGPNLIAIAPWLDGNPAGNPPAPGSELTYRELLQYSPDGGDDRYQLNDYRRSDEWVGGAWLESNQQSAVVFVGWKGSGYIWYGYYTPADVDAPPLFNEGAPCVYEEINYCFQPDGITPCDAADRTPCQGADVQSSSRAFWSSHFDALMLFYDPADLAAVANGSMEPFQPQPYAQLDLDPYLFLNADEKFDASVDIGIGTQRKERVGETAFDRQNGFLYMLEMFSDDYASVVHVFEVAGSGSGGDPVHADSNRIINHVTSSTGGFQTTLYVSHVEENGQAAEVVCQPSLANGDILEPVRITMEPGSYRQWLSPDIFGDLEVSHFTIVSPNSCRVSVGYRIAMGNGATAHVNESVANGRSFLIYPGEQDLIFDGFALVNLGNEPSEIGIELLDTNGVALTSEIIHASLAPNAKFLHTLDSYSLNGVVAARITSSQTASVLFLRGSRPGVSPGYLFQVLPTILQ